MLKHLAYRDGYRPGEEDGRAFVELMREWTVKGFYTSRIGLEHLGYPGLRTSGICMILAPTRMTLNTSTFRPLKSEPEAFWQCPATRTTSSWSEPAPGGGMACKTLCEASLKVLALNSGRRVNPEKDFRGHRQPYEMKFRGFGDPRVPRYHDEHEYTQGLWEHDITYANAPGTNWEWLRVKVTGGSATSGVALRRGLVISISRRRPSTVSTSTGRLLTKRLRRTIAAWSAMSESRAPCRIDPVIPMANTFLLCLSAALTISCKRRRRKLVFPICRTASPSSPDRTAATPLAITVATAARAATQALSSRPPGSLSLTRRKPAVWNCGRTRLPATYL
jgi:hypothetical protein